MQHPVREFEDVQAYRVAARRLVIADKALSLQRAQDVVGGAAMQACGARDRAYSCFVTKLGDRHLTNILISTSGKFIHIDYEYNFGTGLLLPYPEWVPFRLT